MQEAPPATVLLRLPAVMARTGLSRSAIYRRERAGTFPAHVKLGPGRTCATAWLATDIERWIADCVAASREAA